MGEDVFLASVALLVSGVIIYSNQVTIGKWDQHDLFEKTFTEWSRTHPRLSVKSDTEVTKRQADGYAKRFYALIKQTKQDTPEYKKFYEGYMYYGVHADWNSQLYKIIYRVKLYFSEILK